MKCVTRVAVSFALLMTGLTACTAEQTSESTPAIPYPSDDRLPTGQGLPPQWDEPKPAFETAPFRITTTQPGVTVVPGDVAHVSVVVERDPGFLGAIDLSIVDLPAGLTSDEVHIPSDATSGVLTVLASIDSSPVENVAAVLARSGTSEAGHPLSVRISLLGSGSSLDPSFGDDGMLWVHAVKSIVELPDERLVMASPTIGVCGHHPNGSLDLAFGVDGCVQPMVAGLRLQSVTATDTAVLAGGWVPTATSTVRSVVIARLSHDGDLDPTFGTGGWVELDFVHSMITRIVSQDDGSVLVLAGGWSNHLFRLLPNGVLDTNFGTGGMVNLGDGFYARGLVMEPNGRSFVSTSQNVYAFDGQGVPDLAFGGGDGVSSGTTQGFMFRSVDGSLVNPHGPMGMVRLSSSGEEIGRIQPIWEPYASIETRSAAIDHDAHMIYGGSIHEDVPHTALARRSLDGVVDTEFGDNGVLRLPFKGRVDGILILRSGRILAFGIAYGSDEGEEPYVPTRYFQLRLAN